jgi:hypothetical protein
MIKSTKIALVVACAMFAAPAAMARPHHTHAHTAWHASQVFSGPGYAFTPQGPGYAYTHSVGGPNWGSECVTDEGQGRFFPCDSLP